MTISPALVYIAAMVAAAAGVRFILVSRHRPADSEPAGGGAPRQSLLIGGGLLALGLILGGGTYVNSSTARFDSYRQATGKPAPELTFRLVETDDEVRLSDYRGKVVVLNLWASWCAPCLEEIPALNRFQQDFGERGVVVVTISDEREDWLKEFSQKTPFRTVNGYLPTRDKFPRPYDRVERARPTTFVIDREGIIRATWPGAASYTYFAGQVEPFL